MDKNAKNTFVSINRDEGSPVKTVALKDLSPLHVASYPEPTHSHKESYSFEELEDVYINFPSGYHSIDENGYVIRINDIELDWLGYSKEEVVAKMKFTELLIPECRKQFSKNFTLFKKTGSLTVAEYYYQRKDGTSFPVLLNANALYDEEGNFKRSRTIVFNMSDRKLLEFQLLQNHQELLKSQIELQKKNEALNEANEKLFMVNREKDRFIGMASHDLRTPLVSIMMLSDVLRQDSQQYPHKEGFDIASTIHEAAVQMQDMIDDYLNVNRIESGNVRLKLQDLDITQFTKKIVSRHEEIARRKNITIYYLSKKEYHVITDEDAYTQIIENLISNAIKYTHPGKSIYVRINRRFGRTCVAVQDEGVGMQKEEMPLLFRRFQKLSSRPTAGEVSTGLGLSIVKYLADQLGAIIKVESTPGVGSQFMVCL